jgi:ABC-type branched-subunit amino acid transport system substrate-binding protein
VSKNHKTVLITHELSQDTISKAPAGLLLTPDITAERRIDVLMSLLKSQGTLKGKKVAILAETGTKPRVKSAIKPALDSLGVQQGTTAVISTGTNPDTTAAQQQLGSFIERWKSEGVNAIVISGLDIVAKQFVEQIKQQMPDALLMTDGESSANQAGQDETKAGKKPNPYEGMLTANGNTDDETFASPSVQKCVSVYQAATGETVLAPNKVKAGADGHRAEVYQGVEDACGELTFFKVIATKVGQYLNNTNWTNTVNSFGSMNGMLVGSQFASLKTRKYDADNGFRLVSFDSTIPPSGNWKSVTPIQDTAAG